MNSEATLLKQAKEIKLLVLDIDGTISGRSNQVSQPVLNAIAAVQRKGIQVAIATGRMYKSAQRFHAVVNSTLPLLAYQGAWIQEPGQPRLRHCQLQPELALQILDYYEQPHLRDQVSVHFYIDDRLHLRELSADSKEYCDRCETEPTIVGDFRTVISKDALPTKILAISHDEVLVQTCLGDLRDRHNSTDLYLTTSVPHFLEAAHPQSNKGSAVQFLAEEVLGLSSNQVMAIGDNCNDLEMLAYAGIGVAMKGGPDIVQASANWVAPHVDEDGVAQVLQQFLLV